MKTTYILAFPLAAALCLPALAAGKKAQKAPPITLMSTFIKLKDNAWEKRSLVKDVQTLLDQGADPNVYGSSDGVVVSPLRFAVRIKDPAVIKMLLEKGADPNHEGNVRLAQELVVSRMPELFELLLSYGWKFDPNKTYGYMQYGKSYPLCEAVFGRDIPMVRYLLKLGADPLLKDESGRNAFDYCDEISTSKNLLFNHKKEDLVRAQQEINAILKEAIEKR